MREDYISDWCMYVLLLVKSKFFYKIMNKNKIMNKKIINLKKQIKRKKSLKNFFKTLLKII